MGALAPAARSHHARVPHRARRDEPGKILKFEGSYHGLHDTALRQRQAKAEDYGDPMPQFRSRGGGVAQRLRSRMLSSPAQH